MQPRSWCWLRERIDHGQWLRKRIFRWGWFGDPQHLMLFFRHFDRLRTSWAQKNRKWWFWCIPMSKPRVRNHTPFDWTVMKTLEVAWWHLRILCIHRPSLPTCKRPAQNFCSQVDSSSVASIDIGVFRRLNESVVYKERHGIPNDNGILKDGSLLITQCFDACLLTSERTCFEPAWEWDAQWDAPAFKTWCLPKPCTEHRLFQTMTWTHASSFFGRQVGASCQSGQSLDQINLTTSFSLSARGCFMK